MIKYTLLILPFLFSLTSKTINAQELNPYPVFKLDKESKEVMHSAEYIFEGNIIEYKCFYNSDSSNIYTSWTINITSIYKGKDLVLGTVELIELGGEIGLDNRRDRHNRWYGGNKSCVYFCKKNIYQSISEINFDNSIKVSFVNEYLRQVGYVNDVYKEIEMQGLNDISFKTKEDFEKELQKIKGVKIPEKPIISPTK